MDRHLYKDRINTFIKKGNYHAALNIALSALNACRKEQDQEGVDLFLGIIKMIAQILGEEFGSESYLKGQ